jgi:hypothetical protein
MKAATFEHFAELVSGYLLLYCGRSLADLPAGVTLWLRWAHRRGTPAQAAAEFLADVRWPGRVTLDADPLVPRQRREVQARLGLQVT